MTRARDTSQTQDNGGGAVAPYVAGKNKIINGDFGIWQRGTSIALAEGVFGPDRYKVNFAGGVPSGTMQQQTFTAGTAPVLGYEGTYFGRWTWTTLNSCTVFEMCQPIEDVRIFANQIVTLSFWAKADTTRTLTSFIRQNFGSGGSGNVDTVGQSNSLTTSWQRFTFTVALPSISGKTIGTGSSLQIKFSLPATANTTIDIWGVQVEAGSTATSFQTATGTLQGELAACQRYYWRASVGAYNYLPGTGSGITTTSVHMAFPLHQTMRVSPTSVDFSAICFWDGVTQSAVATAAAIQSGNADTVIVIFGGTSGITVYRPYLILTNNATGYIGLNAEL